MDEKLRQLVAGYVAQGMSDDEIARRLQDDGYVVGPVRADSARTPMVPRATRPDASAQSFVPPPARQYRQRDAWSPSALARTLGQGLTLSFGDELEGGVRALGSKLMGDDRPFGDIYEEGREKAEEDVLSYRESHPFLSGATEVVGGALTGTGVARAGAKAAQRAGLDIGEAATRTLGRRVASTTAAGATGGAVAGAGASQPGQRVPGMAMGAGIGAVAPVVGKGLGKVGGAVGRMIPGLSRLGAEDEARARILRAILNDETSPPELRAKAIRLFNQKAKPEMLFDIAGPNVQRSADIITQAPGKGATRIIKAVSDREAGAAGRVADDLKLLGDTFDDPELSVPGGTQVPRPAGDVAREMTDEFADLYEQAYARGGVLSREELAPYLERPSAREAWKVAERHLRDAGKEVPDIFDDAGRLQRNLTVEEFDTWKRALDDTLEDPDLVERGGLGRSGIANVQRNLREPALAYVDEVVPEYGQAREKAGTFIRAERAGLRGQGDLRGSPSFLRESPSELLGDFRTFDEPAKEMYRVGARRNLRSTLGTFGDPEFGSHQNIARRLFGTPDRQANVVNVFGDKGREVIDLAKRESDMFLSGRDFLGGSQTMRRAFSAADMNDVDPLAIAGSVYDGMRGGWMNAGRNLFNAAQRRAQGLTPRSADLMADALTAPNAFAPGRVGASNLPEIAENTPLVRYLDDLESWRKQHNNRFYWRRGRTGGATGAMVGATSGER